MPTTSIREQIIVAIVAILGAGGKPAGLIVHRNRTRTIESDTLPAILVYAQDDEPKSWANQQYGAPLVERQLAVFLEYRALGALTVPIDETLDPLIVWGTRQMVANEKFGGLGNGVVEGKTLWLSKEGDQVLAAASQLWTVKYRTSRLDPTLRT